MRLAKKETKPPSSQATKSHAGRAGSYKPQKRALDKTILPTPISTKGKEWVHEKKRSPKLEA